MRYDDMSQGETMRTLEVQTGQEENPPVRLHLTTDGNWWFVNRYGTRTYATEAAALFKLIEALETATPATH